MGEETKYCFRPNYIKQKAKKNNKTTTRKQGLMANKAPIVLHSWSFVGRELGIIISSFNGIDCKLYIFNIFFDCFVEILRLKKIIKVMLTQLLVNVMSLPGVFISPSFHLFTPPGMYARDLAFPLPPPPTTLTLPFFQRYEVISVPVVQSERQQKRLPA